MSRSVALCLAALTLFFALPLLTLDKPGLPAGLKADEAAYYMMSLSLAHDGDLRLEPADVDRVFREFPYGPVDNLIVMTDDGWRSVYFGKPYLYSLFAAPFARAAGADGMLFFNMLLALAMVWMGTVYLGRFNRSGPAALFAAGSTFASVGFAYVFWLQPEVFNMAAVAAACFLALHRPGDPAAVGGVPRPRRDWLWLAASGAALALAAYNKPVFVALALPLLGGPLVARRWRVAAAWAAGFALSAVAACGLAVALTGHPTSYLGVERMGVTVCEPGVMPVEPRADAEAGPPPDRPTGGAWSWIFHLPEVGAGELAENLGYFLWGRHTGLLLYFPFAALAVVLFLLHGRRRLEGWLLLAALAVVALFFLVFIPHNWQGGGGFVGNRYYVNVSPAFLYLVTGLRPRWLTAAGWAVAGLFLGPLLLSPFGRSVPEPTLQSHVRGAPFRAFPLELSLREVPGYHRVTLGGRSFLGRRDVMLPRGESFWLRGATTSELWVVGTEPLERAALLVSSVAPDNRIELELGEARAERTLGAGESARFELAPGRPDRVRRQGDAVFYVYELTVRAEDGRIRPWTRRFPPESCTYFAANESWEESFYVGAELSWLGDGAALDADVYAVDWRRVEAPPRMTAGAEAAVPVRLANASASPWSFAGAARVKLSYRWLAADGSVAVANGRRTELPLPVAAGEEVEVTMGVEAPATPGTYRLVVDPVFEHVAWFSSRGAAPWEATVEVTAAAEPGEPAGQPASAVAGETASPAAAETEAGPEETAVRPADAPAGRAEGGASGA